MKDMFDREIAVDDTVVYATKGSCFVNMRIARVISVELRTIHVQVVAGNDGAWKTGQWFYDRKTGSSYHREFKGWAATLRASHHIMVANGINVEAVRVPLLWTQAVNLQGKKAVNQ